MAPAPKVLGPKHISNPDFAPFLKNRGVVSEFEIAARVALAGVLIAARDTRSIY